MRNSSKFLIFVVKHINKTSNTTRSLDDVDCDDVDSVAVRRTSELLKCDWQCGVAMPLI